MLKLQGRIITLLILGMSFIFSFSGCNKMAGDVTIGFLIPATEGSRWIYDRDYVEDYAKENEVEVLVRSAENDENLQLKQASELLDMGIDVLIVVPVNQNTSAAIVRDAHEKSVPVISYDRLIKNSDLDYILSFKGEAIGTNMTDYALKHKPKGNYVVLWGDYNDANALFIKDAQAEALKPYIENGQINIVYKTFIESWSREHAKHAMEKVLRFTDKKIDAVITSYDGLALGAIDAFEEAGYDYSDVIITGQDAELEAVRAIRENKMSLTIYKPIPEIARTAVEISIKLAHGDEIDIVNDEIYNGRKDVPAILLTPKVVTKDKIRSVLIDEGFYSEAEVFGN